MSPIAEHVEREKRPKLGGGGPGKIPYRRGFGGGDDGDRGRSDDFRSGRDRLRRFRVGIVAGIVSVAMLFAGLTAAYMMRHGGYHWNSQTHIGHGDWHPLTLPYRLLFVNTLVLVLSSVTLELARRGLLRKAEFTALGILPPKLQTDLPWLGLTVLLGFGFLGGQILAWNFFRQQGIYLASYPSGSFFYLLTGLHALHLLGGLVVLVCTLAGSWMRMKLDNQRIAVDVTGWYWHFMAVLWIYIFAILHFARGS
ncbi:MAG TPA: cytochrome c oxidase subunit 3 [Candidatus Angelobacter sp.]